VGPVAQAAHTLGVVTRDGVTERLPLISARRAASARDSPSSAWAIAYARDAARGSFDRFAHIRKEAGVRSRLIANAMPYASTRLS
jgi:hypothetical protein